MSVEAILALIGLAAKAVPEVGAFFHDLIAGKPEARDRVAAILPVKSESAAAADAIASKTQVG